MHLYFSDSFVLYTTVGAPIGIWYFPSSPLLFFYTVSAPHYDQWNQRMVLRRGPSYLNQCCMRQHNDLYLCGLNISTSWQQNNKFWLCWSIPKDTWNHGIDSSCSFPYYKISLVLNNKSLIQFNWNTRAFPSIILT